MVAPDPQFHRSAILHLFNHAQLFLFLGDAIITIGLLAAAFALLRRRWDRPLLWFALFAVLYGLRLCLNYQLLWALQLRPPVLQRITVAIGFLIPIPAFFFFRDLDLFGGKGRNLCNIVWPVSLGLALAELVFGNQPLIRQANNLFVLAALLVVVILLVRTGSTSRDVTLIRRGLFFFVACAVYDNVTGLVGWYLNIEPFSFVVLLAALGIVVGRRTLATEQQLTTLQKELEIAQEIQLSILPSAFPRSRSFRVAARYLPMTSVAGDFYDFLLANDSEAALLVADVSGHGIPAALIASMVKLAATSQRAHADSPADLLHGMNQTLMGNTQRQYVTAGYVYLNADLQELRYSAAAHPPMLLLRNGQITEIVENGLMLAAFDFATYATRIHPIEPGDRLVLYTDGLLEAANIHQEEFGPDRLHALIRETASISHTDAADSIISSVQRWSAAQTDDLTVLLCDYAV